ncbi:MAG: PAS domain S-box protein [Chloroflexi bacterium]|nr:PAS domain S-box protein [Chloroflexota bacterium]
MTKQISVLIVEDSESDANLISRTLKKCGYKLVFERVENSVQMRTALKKHPWDIVISDHSLPQFDSFAALRLTQEEGLDIPFIAVSGTVSEETAVAIMRAGAHDYLMKGDLTRLGPAVERELEQAKIRRERRQIESINRVLVENSIQGVAIFQEGKIVYANPALSKIHGYTYQELKAMSDRQILAITHPDDRALSKERMKKREAGEWVQPYLETRILRKDGSTAWVQLFTDQIEYNGQSAILSTMIDITDRKMAQDAVLASEQRFRALIENGLDDISLLKADGTLIWESPSVIRNLDYAPNDFIGRNILELLHPDDVEKIQDLFTDLTQKPGTRKSGIFRLKHNDGTWRWAEAIASNMLDIPSIQAIVVNYRDITERKRMEEELHNSEQLFKDLVNNIEEVFWITEPISKIDQYISPGHKKVWGRSLKDVDDFIDSIDPADQPMVEAVLKKQARGEKTEMEYRVKHADGSTHWVWDRAFPIYDTTGGLKSIAGIATDITKRKLAEEGLQNAGGFLQSVQDALSAHIAILDNKGTIVQVNSAWRNFGAQNNLVHANHCIGTNYLDICDSAEETSASAAALVAGAIRKALNGTKDEARIEYPCHAQDQKRWFVARITSFENTGRTWVVVSHENITERKQMEEMLRDSEEKYRLLFKNNPLPMWIYDLETLKFLQVNDATINHYGYSTEEFLSMTVADIRPQEEIQQFLEYASKLRSGIEEIETWHHVKKDGSVIFVEIIAHKVEFSGRQAILVLANDITKREESEQRLRKSEQNYRALFEDMPISIWEEDFSEAKSYLDDLKRQGITDLRRYFKSNPEAFLACATMIKILNVNQATLKMYMAETKEDLYKSMDEGLTENEVEHLNDALIAISEGKLSHTWEGIDRTVRGKPIQISLSWSVAPGYEEDFSKVIVTTMDITERKLGEEALQQSEKRFRALIANTGDLIVVIDPQGLIQFASPSASRILGYDSTEVTGIPFTDWVHPDDLPEVLDALTSRLQEPGVSTESIQARGRHRDGSWHILDTIGTNLLNEPAVRGIVLNIRDITEREQAEEALRTSEAQFRAIFEGAAIGMALVDETGHPVRQNPALHELLGYDEQELSKMIFTDFTHPDDANIDWALWQELISGKRESYQIEKRFIHKDGHTIWVKLVTSIIRGKDGIFSFGVGMVEDITERKQAEMQIKYQLAELEALYENGLAISRLLEPKQIARRMVEVIDQKLDWHHAAIRLYDAETDHLELLALNSPGSSEAQTNEQIKRINQSISTPDKGLSGWVIRHGEVVRIGKLKDDPRYLETYPGIKSGLYVPIRSGDEIIGSIAVESEQENAFSQRDEHTLTTLANQAAISFVNARLYLLLQKGLDERHRAEEEVRKLNIDLEHRVAERTVQIEATKRRLELAAMAGQIGVWEYNPRSNRVIWDERMHIIHQIPFGDFDGTSESWAQLIHPDDLEKSQINKQLAFTQSLLINNEYRILLPNGSTRDIHSNSITVFSEDGIPDRIIGINMDITDRKQIEQSLRESEAYARLLFDAVQDPVSVTEANLDGKIVDVNEMFEKEYGILRDEARGKRISELGIYPETELAKREIYLAEILQGHAAQPVELQYYKRGERIKTLEFHSYPIVTFGRQLILNTSHDITQHKRAEETQRLAKSEMERALRIKNEFLATMSHELRTPLNSILGISESLEEQIAGVLNEKQQKYIGIIRESGRHLLELINDILDLSKIEAGRMELDIHHVAVGKICESSLRLVRELGQKKSLNVSFNLDGQVHIVSCDERRMKQCLVNLLSNAVKFTPPGSRIGLDVTGFPERNEVEFTVWDQGIGIAQQDIQRIFKPFVQLDAGLTREYQGTGLGLALVAQIANMHGGRIRVESASGSGSRFTITLPWPPEAQAILSKGTAPISMLPIQRSDKNRNGRILLVEDTDVVVQLISEYLRYKGYEVILAQNGAEGLELASQEHPDLILMDVMMPVMNGLEATEKIRLDPSLKITPIIALTALAMSGDMERCLAAGMNDYLSKPIQLQNLADMIEKYLGPTREKSNEK